jgi:hypothetical protein
MKFILLGLVTDNDNGLEASQEIIISPIGTKITIEHKALILCNKKETVPVLKHVQFSDMVHTLKLKYFYGTIEAPNKKTRKTMKGGRVRSHLEQTAPGMLHSVPLINQNNIRQPMLYDENSCNEISEEGLLAVSGLPSNRFASNNLQSRK